MLHTRRLPLALAFCAALASFASLASAQGTTWYLAEGATLSASQFEEEILIGNPNGVDATVTLTFLRDDGTAVAPFDIVVPATSRKTVRVNDLAGMDNAAASARITSNVDVVVERSMYWMNRQGGHNAAAVAAPSTTWYLAEGATAFGFQDYVLVANPNPTPANVTLRFLKRSGGVTTFPLLVAAGRRESISVNQQVPGMSAEEFSTVVEADQPVFAERAMYWNNMKGGTASTGVVAPLNAWHFAEGYTAGGFETFLLVGNPSSSQDADVTLTVYREGQPALTKGFTVARGTRESIWMNRDVPGLGAEPFSMKVESTGAPVIAERAEYWGNYTDGHTTAGMESAQTGWAFAEGIQGGHGGRDYDTYFLFANDTGSDSAVEATFYREDGTGIVRTFTVPAQSRFTLPASVMPELTNQKFAAFFRSTNGVGFYAERAVYWGAGYVGGHGSAGTPWTLVPTVPPSPPLPVATGLSPSSGGANGGTALTVTGTNFMRGVPTNVGFGGALAPSVTVVDATTLSVVTPPHAAGTVDVTVWNGGGTTVLPGAFTFTAVGPPPPPPPPACGATICDNLQGSTVGQQFGGRYDSFGYVIGSTSQGIKYVVPTIGRGYFEMEVTGIRPQGDEGNLKNKIMAMYDGGWSSDDPYRSTAEKRDANKGNVVRFKHLCGSGAAGDYIETDGDTAWNPGEVYKFRIEWGTGFGRLIVTRSNGSTAFVIGGGCRPGPYAPRNHVLTVGNPEGGGDHGSYPGLRVRNVRIGSM